MPDGPGTSLGTLLDGGSVDLAADVGTRDDAIRLVGGMLVAGGAVEPDYAEAMLDRERSVSTYIGEGIAIPHATLSGRDSVHREAIALLRVPEGVAWGDERAVVIIGIAAPGRGHIALLSKLARLLLDPGTAGRLRSAETVSDVRLVLDGHDSSG